jgi:hypothetical protein
MEIILKNSIDFNFDPPSGTNINYRAFIVGEGAIGLFIAPSTFRLSQLLPGLSYSITLLAYNNSGNSAQSSPPVIMFTLPEPPTDLIFISSTSDSVTFSFTPPPSSG